MQENWKENFFFPLSFSRMAFHNILKEEERDSEKEKE
jgi:hypothetical protein